MHRPCQLWINCKIFCKLEKQSGRNISLLMKIQQTSSKVMTKAFVLKPWTLQSKNSQTGHIATFCMAIVTAYHKNATSKNWRVPQLDCDMNVHFDGEKLPVDHHRDLQWQNYQTPVKSISQQAQHRFTEIIKKRLQYP